MEPVEVARLEERRQAIGTAEVSLESEEIGGGIMCFAGKGSWANQACGVGLDGPVSQEEVDRLVAFYVERGVEPRIEVCPFVDESLLRGLEAHKFSVREFGNAYVCELRAETDFRASMKAWPEGLELSWVDPKDEQGVDELIDVSIRPFHPEYDVLPDSLVETWKRVIRHPRSDSFVARIGDVAVGGGGMESAGPVACLFGASVSEEHRRRGIQQALIARRLERAREKGCEFACIHSQPGIATERNAARMGFRLAYTKVVLGMAGEGLERSV